MKIRSLITLVVVLMTIAVPTFAAKKVKVNSLEELLPYLKQNNIDLVMEPGVYRVTAKDVENNIYTEKIEVYEGRISPVLFLFQGNNNTYDFTGVKIEIESAVINSFPGKHSGVNEFQIIGNRNVIKNLKIEDIGSEEDFPRYGWVNIVMDGANNLIEGVEVTSRGSKPYGYGEAFGKGKGYVLKHWKHSSTLIRGDNNHFKNNRIIHHAYGHFLFMQGAYNPTIEGCYIEGKMTSTDTILAEKGSGSSADQIGFKSVWGYTVPSGYTLCLGEDGIRTYTAGVTLVNGERISRKTSGRVTVKDCVVKHARGGVAITLGQGERYVENCTVIGCQSGYSVNSGGVIKNCKADAAFGEALSVNYDHNNNITADITIIPYEGEMYGGNGSKQVAFIQGSGHNITFRKGEGLKEDQDLKIYIGGDKRSIGQLAEDENLAAKDIKIVNETSYPILIDDRASGTTGSTKGKVIDNGTNNKIITK